MITTEIPTLWPPRWIGGPSICIKENLPAFPDAKAAMDFRERNCPGSHVTRLWTCAACGCVHYLAKPQAPSGESSGNSERSELSSGFTPFMRDSTLEAIRSRNHENDDVAERIELPERPAEELAKARPAARAPRKSKSTQSSFL